MPSSTVITTRMPMVGELRVRVCGHVQGRISGWLQHTLGMHPSGIHPSVRCGLEGALLTALSAARGQSLASLLSAAAPDMPSRRPDSHSGLKADTPGGSGVVFSGVEVNGLLACAGPPQECAAEAAAMAARGFRTLKMKVRA